MRTATWCEKLEGGIEHIRDVVVKDSLGIAADLEAMLQRLVDSYQCEWAAVVNDPEKRKRFRQFQNSDETEPGIEFVSERGQSRPADWPGELLSLEQFQSLPKPAPEDLESEDLAWIQVGLVQDFPTDAGATIKYGRTQIAVFNFASRGEWYASQNMCPHKKAFVLARGIVGDQAGEPKIACPLHKKTFSLKTGESLSDAEYSIETFPVKVEDGAVYLRLPPANLLDERHATHIGCALATSCLSRRDRELVEV
jgi:nitrite reductase (NADH) large subunit